MLVSVRRVILTAVAFMFIVIFLPMTGYAGSSVHDQGGFNEINLSVNETQKFHGGSYNTDAMIMFLRIAEEKGYIRASGNLYDGNRDYDLDKDGYYDFNLDAKDTFTFTRLYTCSIVGSITIALTLQDIDEFEANNVDDLVFYSSMEITFPYEIDWLPGDISTEYDKNVFTYNGKVQEPKLKLAFRKKPMVEGIDYYVVSPGAVNAGIYEVECFTTGRYTLDKRCSLVQFTIKKAKNPMKVTPKTATVKYSKVKKANQVLARTKVLKVTSTKGLVTYKKVSGNRKITIASSSGKVTVKKGLKKGTYKVKVKVSDTGDANYQSGYKKVTFKIKVK